MDNPIRNFQCEHCGRTFIAPMAHRCKGNFRKHHLNFKRKNDMTKYCADCKYAGKKGWFCSQFRKNTTPYHLPCESFVAKEEETHEMPKIIDLETNLMYVLMRSVEYLVYDIDRRLRNEKCQFNGDKKKQIAKIQAQVDRTKEEFDKLEKDYTKNLNTSDYDLMMRDAFECIRLMLLYADRCGYDVDNRDAAFKFIRGLASAGVVTEEDLNRFYMAR